MSLTLVPAYGRDYKSAAAVQADWAANKDFIICDISSKDNGRYINKADAEKAGIRVSIRYYKLTRIMTPFQVTA